MSLRSFLFVPGDSERKMQKGLATEADALILDLEDAVAPEHRSRARQRVRELLLNHEDRQQQELWVRVNPLASDEALRDLVAVMGGAPNGIVVPKPGSGTEVTKLDHYLCALEVREDLIPGSTRILTVATETPGALFRLASYADVGPRLFGLCWGAEDLSAAVGASSKWSSEGSYGELYRLARILCLAAARAAGAEPVDGVFTAYRDLEGLRREATAAQREGFSAKAAIHPDQIPVINEAFTPSEEEIRRAQSIVDAFADHPGAGTVGLDGTMLDRPHLTQAERVLRLAARLKPSRTRER